MASPPRSAKWTHAQANDDFGMKPIFTLPAEDLLGHRLSCWWNSAARWEMLYTSRRALPHAATPSAFSFRVTWHTTSEWAANSQLSYVWAGFHVRLCEIVNKKVRGRLLSTTIYCSLWWQNHRMKLAQPSIKWQRDPISRAQNMREGIVEFISFR